MPPSSEPGQLLEPAEARSQFFEQMSQASPDALSIADMRIIACSGPTRLSCACSVIGSEKSLASRWRVWSCPPTGWPNPAGWRSRWQKASASRSKPSAGKKTEPCSTSRFPARLSCSTGRVAGFYAGYHDISDRKRVEALSSALYRVAEKSSSAHELQQFFAAVHGIVDELMYARNFYIALYDPATELLSFPYFVDEQDSAPSPKKLGRGLTDYLIRTGEPLLATPEVLQAMEDRGEVARNGSRSLDWMGVPLKVNNHTFGALVVQTYSKNIRYGERDKEILTFVARQVASAVEIKRNEQALRRSEARYRSLVQSSVYGIYRSSLEGRFLDVNPALITMLGYGSAEEVLLLDPEKDVFAQPEEHDRLIEEFRRTGRLDGIEVKWKRKDGEHDYRSHQRTRRQQRRRARGCAGSHRRGRDRPPRPRRSVPPGAEDGSRRTPGRRRGPRLQQPADGHQRLCRGHSGAARSRASAARKGPRHSAGRRPRHDPDPAIAGLQPKAIAGAESRRRERDRAGHGAPAPSADRRKRRAGYRLLLRKPLTPAPTPANSNKCS